SWIALDGRDFSATLVLPGVTGSVSNLDVTINRGSHAGALNWTSALAAPPVTLTADKLETSGELTGIDAFGLLSGSAFFSISRKTVDAEVDGVAGFNPAAGHDLIGATLVTFALDLTGPSRFLDVGGAGFGLDVDDGTALVAALAPAAAADTRRWIAVQASGLSATLTLPGVDAT